MSETKKRKNHQNCFVNDPPYVLTHHALERMAQRNLSLADIHFVIRYGQQLHRTGIIFYFLGYNDLAKDMRKQHARLEGTIVLMNPKSRKVITAYRDRNGLRKIKCKLPYNSYSSRYRNHGSVH